MGPNKDFPADLQSILLSAHLYLRNMSSFLTNLTKSSQLYWCGDRRDRLGPIKDFSADPSLVKTMFEILVADVG